MADGDFCGRCGLEIGRSPYTHVVTVDVEGGTSVRSRQHFLCEACSSWHAAWFEEDFHGRHVEGDAPEFPVGAFLSGDLPEGQEAPPEPRAAAQGER